MQSEHYRCCRWRQLGCKEDHWLHDAVRWWLQTMTNLHYCMPGLGGRCGRLPAGGGQTPALKYHTLLTTLFLALTSWTWPSTTWTSRTRPAAWRPSARLRTTPSTTPWPGWPSTPSSKTIDQVDQFHNRLDPPNNVHLWEPIFLIRKWKCRTDIPIFSSSFRGLAKYQHAVNAGQNGEGEEIFMNL